MKNIIRFTLVLSVLFLAFGSFAAWPPAWPGTWLYCSPTGTGNGSSINTPCSVSYGLANTTAGNTLVFLDGDYSGEIDVGTSGITLGSYNKWKARILNSAGAANSSGLAVYPNGTHNVTIDGFCITNCLANGISLFGPSNIVKNCWVTHNGTAGYGGPSNGGGYGIYGKSQAGTMVDSCLVENNGSVASFDQAVYVGGTNCTVRNNVIRYNYAFGIQIEVFSGAADQCQIYNNLCYSNAVGLANAYEISMSADSGVALGTNFFYGNTILSRRSTISYINDGLACFTNNILLGAQSTGATGTTQSGNNNTSPSSADFVAAGRGLFWLSVGASERGAASSTICGPVNFFSNSQSSVSDIGAFQYTTALTNDIRTLDPSPPGGADYWKIPSGPTYYIDFAGGSDSNNGTDPSTPWRHHPYMGGWTGVHSHSAGESYIFKGGVTWDQTCFPMNIGNGGSSSSVMDYYGVSSDYHTGLTWSRPIFNDNSNAVVFVQINTDNVVLDNFEMKGFYWNASMGFGAGSHITLGTHYAVITNCYLHGWAYGPSAGGGNMMCILGATSGTGNARITHCIFDGSPYGSNAMYAVYVVPNVDNCVVSNLSNGLVYGAGTTCQIYSNNIGPINQDFGGVHGNAIEPEGTQTTSYIHHNIIHDIASGAGACVLLGDSGTTYYFYNNLITNSAPIPLQNDSSINQTKASTTYAWNNTIVGSGNLIRNVRGQNTWFVQNNHFIGTTTPINFTSYPTTAQTIDHNVTNSTIGSLGYTYANSFQPTTGTSQTVDAGTTITTVTNDLLGISRPKGAAYDAGAYEFVQGANTWYVDNTAGGGANNGTSWGNAWTSFASINWALINPGDTIYISGGSTSQTYTDVWSVGASGTYGFPITITISANDPTHNGLVIFDYNSQGDTCTTSVAITCNQSYITFDGNVGGTPHFVVQNLRNITNRYAGDCWSFSGTSNIIRFCTTTNCNNPVTTSGLGNCVNNNIFAQTRGDRCVNLGSAGSGFDAVFCYSNICEILYNTSVPVGGTGPYLGPDGIQCGNGASMHDNKLIITTTGVYTSSQHPDMCQCIGNYVKWYNNEIVNIGDSGFDYDCYANSNPHDIWIFNNLYHINTWIDPFPEYFRMYTSSGTINSIINVKIFNNTYDGADGDQRVIWFDQFNGSNPAFAGIEIKNNIFYNCGTSTSFDQLIHVGTSTAITNGAFSFDYNVYYSTNAPEWIGFNGTTYSVTNWISTNEPHSRTNQPQLTSYTYRSANNNYQLTSVDTAAKDQGTSLSSFFNFDHVNVARPQGSAWDIGAYESTLVATNFYASPTGSSANNGLSTNAPWPFVYSCQHVGNGNNIWLMDGVYQNGGTLNVDITNVSVAIRAINKWQPQFLNCASDGTGGIIRVGASVRGDGLVIDGLSFSNAQYYPILIRYVGSTNCVVRNCLIRNTGQTFAASSSASGLQFYPGFSNVVEYCLIENNGTNGSLTHNHGIYTGGTNCVYRGNVIRGNGGYGINIDGHGNPSVDINNQVYENLVYGNYGGGTLNTPGDQIAIYDDSVSGPSSGTQTNYVFGNTVISPGAYAIICQNGNIRLTNNIIISTSDGIHKFSSFSSDVINADYNMAPQALGYPGPHDVVSSNYGFLNSANGLYWLTSSSQARNSALFSVAGPVDFFGNTQSSVSDIGAFQYSSLYATDTRVLDPSPATGADYWAILTSKKSNSGKANKLGPATTHVNGTP